MKITYAITVCDEFVEIQRLIAQLLKGKRPQDEIVVLVDMTKNEPTSELLGYLHRLSSNNYIHLSEQTFNNHFADWKNHLTSICSGDYIFQIDADEYPDELFISHLPDLLELTWVNKVHEKLVGYKSYAMLPADTRAFSLYHPKTIQKQEKQNNYYSTL